MTYRRAGYSYQGSKLPDEGMEVLCVEQLSRRRGRVEGKTPGELLGCEVEEAVIMW